MRLPLALVPLLGAPASASGVDAHGLVAPPTDGAVDDPVGGWSGRALGRGVGAVGLRLGWAHEPAVAWRSVDGGDPVRVRILDDVFDAEVGGLIGLSDRVAIGAAVPVFLGVSGDALDGWTAAGGPALGDAQLWAPIQLAGRPGDAGGLAVVPWLGLPTGRLGGDRGATARALGDGGIGAGATVAGTVAAGPIAAFGNLGVEVRRENEWFNVRKGTRLRAAVGLGATLSPGLVLRGEVVSAPNLASSSLDSRPDATRLARAPVEATLALRGRLAERATLLVGGSTALTPGVGAARGRAFAQVAWSFGARDAASADTPEVLGDDRVVVVDAAGVPIPGAAVAASDALIGLTDLAGELPLTRARDRRDVAITARGYEPAALRTVDRGRVVVPLAASPVRVRVRVADAEGRALAASAVLVGPDGEVALPLGDDGRGEETVAPGAWTLRVEAEGFGAQERAVEIRPGASEIDAEILLLPAGGQGGLTVVVRDPDGRPIDGAAVGIDGTPIGATSTGGTVGAARLGAAARRVSVEAAGYLPATRTGVRPSDPGATLEVVLAPEPGSVELVVRSPHGPVPDATARWAGPSRLSFEVGPEGRKTFVLRPGTWTLLVGSPRYGLQQRVVEIPEQAFGRRTIEVELRPPEAGEAALAIRVVDVDGAPIDGASVALDGASVGATSTGGALTLSSLAPGTRRIAVSGPLLAPVQADVAVIDGLTEATIVARYLPGATRVRATSPAAAVVDATARFAGPSPVPTVALGADGEETLALPAGAWRAVVASPEHGLQQRAFEVAADDPRLHVVDVVFGPPGGGRAELDLRVRDPLDRPVVGARVGFGGDPLGTTGGDGGLVASGLAPGARVLTVDAPMLASHAETLRLRDARLEHTVRAGWGVGAVRVEVLDADGAPATDAMLRFAGSRYVPPAPVDGLGTLHLGLEPGSWVVVAASPGSGLAQLVFDVPAEPGLTTVPLRLPRADGSGRLLVRVQDADGIPVAGARVALGDQVVEAVIGGTALFSGPPGRRALAVDAAGFVPYRGPELAIAAGDQERVVTLDFVPVPLRVRVTGPGGAAVPATVRLDGPVDAPPVVLDATGAAVVGLRPGGWTVLAEAPGLGAASARVLLPPGDAGREVTLSLRPAEVDVDAGGLRLRQVIAFDFNSATLRPSADPLLDEVAAVLLARPGLRRVEIEGHTDTVGGVPYNLELSRRRAEAVRAALIARGVAPERLRARGYGPTRPLVTGDDEAARAANRRVAFRVVESAADE